MMPDTQTLVEKIVKLQRSCARRQVWRLPIYLASSYLHKKNSKNERPAVEWVLTLYARHDKIVLAGEKIFDMDGLLDVSSLVDRMKKFWRVRRRGYCF
jgi:hypothetical protein